MEQVHESDCMLHFSQSPFRPEGATPRTWHRPPYGFAGEGDGPAPVGAPVTAAAGKGPATSWP